MPVFDLLALAVLVALAGACVVPLAPEVIDADAGIDYPPVIVASNPPMPGIFQFESDPPREYSLTVSDQDVADVIYVRVIRDLNTNQGPQPIPVVSKEVVNGALGNHLRQFTIDSSPFCGLSTTGEHTLDVFVADRPFVDASLMATTKGGLGHVTTRSWVLTCP
jgi:hypothetical protein